MLTRFHSVSVDDPLDQVANLIISDSQSEFPVMDGPAVAGVLSRTELLEALRRSGATAPARTAMRTDFITLEADEPLEPALGRLSESPVPMAPVMWQQRLVGLLTLENAGEFIAIRRALVGGSEATSDLVVACRWAGGLSGSAGTRISLRASVRGDCG